MSAIIENQEIDTNEIIESAPVDTSFEETPVVNKPAVEEDAVEEDGAVEKPEDDASEQDSSEEMQEETDTKEDTPADEPDASSSVDTELLKRLSENSKYRPTDTNFDILDEYGALDPEKFQAFMAENNQNVFNQATNAVLTKLEAEKIEADAWGKVYTDYPELKENKSLESALKGARIQDLVSGGKGDLIELAKGIVGPIRDNKIKAVESANKTIKKQESLSSFKPNVAQIEKVPTSLMTQLKQAISDGDSDTANRIRHEIRKERIFGKAEQ